MHCALRPFVQARMHAPAQFDVLQPVQDEQRAFDAAQLAQRERQAALARVGYSIEHGSAKLQE